MKTARAAVLPSSALGKAVSYTLSLWHKLTRFLEHPELELSNNLAENSMRPVAPGSEKLATRWKREGWSEGSRDSLDRGILPAA